MQKVCLQQNLPENSKVTTEPRSTSINKTATTLDTKEQQNLPEGNKVATQDLKSDAISLLAIKQSIEDFKNEYHRLYTMGLAGPKTLGVYCVIIINNWYNVFIDPPTTLNSWHLNKYTSSPEVATKLQKLTNEAIFSIRAIKTKRARRMALNHLKLQLPNVKHRLDIGNCEFDKN